MSAVPFTVPPSGNAAFEHVHEVGQAPETAAMRQPSPGQYMFLQNLPLEVHILPRRKQPRSTSLASSNGGKRATGE
jgi:hypothetical protein